MAAQGLLSEVLRAAHPLWVTLVAHILDEKRMSTHYCWGLWRLRVCGWSLCLGVSPDATLPAGW